MVIEVLRRSAVVALLAFGAASAAACSGAPTASEGGSAADPLSPAAPEATAQSSEALTGAVDCGAMVRGHMAFVRSNTCGSGGLVGYELVTHQASGLVSIANGWLGQQTPGLVYANPITHVITTIPGTLSSGASTSDGTQAFSDRTVYATISGTTTSALFSFNPRAQDQLKVTLRDNGTATVKFVSWGGGEVTVTPTECMNNVMYGFGNGALYSFTFTDQCSFG